MENELRSNSEEERSSSRRQRTNNLQRAGKQKLKNRKK
jgi:hypothetical protein